MKHLTLIIMTILMIACQKNKEPESNNTFKISEEKQETIFKRVSSFFPKEKQKYLL